MIIASISRSHRAPRFAVPDWKDEICRQARANLLRRVPMNQPTAARKVTAQIWAFDLILCHLGLDLAACSCTVGASRCPHEQEQATQNEHAHHLFASLDWLR
jgi:hypothetical protein